MFLRSQHTGGVRVDTEKRRGGVQDGGENITEDLSMSNLFPTAGRGFKGGVQVKAEYVNRRRARSFLAGLFTTRECSPSESDKKSPE